MLRLDMMKEILYETIVKLEVAKKAEKKEPAHVLYLELKNEVSEMVKAALTELWQEKKIKSGHTKNDLYIRSNSPCGKNDQNQ